MNASHQDHHPWTRAESVLKKHSGLFGWELQEAEERIRARLKRKLAGDPGKGGLRGILKAALGERPYRKWVGSLGFIL
jgi:hypothetical protein